MTFKSAVFISGLVHLFIILPSYLAMPKQHIEQRNPIAIDYVVIKDLEKLEEAKREQVIAETPKVELKREMELKPAANQEMTKSAEAPKDASQDLARRQAQIRSTKDYINYYQLIREKIRRKLKTNYRDYSNEGEVDLVFTLSSNGTLLKVDIERDKSTDDRILLDIAASSLKQASPFPAFPKDLAIPQMSFNLTISFKRR